ncbi:DUF4397 domain-containing protein [Chitinophaga ginsengisoli]|uniref:Uncharacterized protein DUF4397 n=1 Tax=Chitinophaga ginsengisoli TaxID=363837 RepID=A0A2P8GDQ1_9BACT|nr:DUF4397 domain-containing protein [Chitinophaga ginsengisoli]PSL32107.1 uncharacterized protein DUF4397 [Chitinophaga ginsengisoli]
MTTKKTRVWAIAALVTVVTSFSACLKSDNVTPQRDRAAVAIINGILTNGDLDFYDNSTKVNSNALSIGFTYIGYPIYGGVRTFSFKKAGQTTDYVAVTNLYDSLTYNTVVAYGDSTAPQMRSIKDDFTGAKETAVNIRFFHLSPSAGPVDLYIDDVKVDSNRTYVGTSGFRTAFTPLSKPVYTNNIKIKAAGTSTVLVENSSPSASFSNGRVYTITLIGSKDYTDKRKLAVNSLYSLY